MAKLKKKQRNVWKSQTECHKIGKLKIAIYYESKDMKCVIAHQSWRTLHLIAWFIEILRSLSALLP